MKSVCCVVIYGGILYSVLLKLRLTLMYDTSETQEVAAGGHVVSGRGQGQTVELRPTELSQDIQQDAY